MNAEFHWIEDKVAVWPVLKKWNEPSWARMIGPILEECANGEVEGVNEFVSRISTSDMMEHIKSDIESWPIGGNSSVKGRNIEVTRSR